MPADCPLAAILAHMRHFQTLTQDGHLVSGKSCGRFAWKADVLTRRGTLVYRTDQRFRTLAQDQRFRTLAQRVSPVFRSTRAGITYRMVDLLFSDSALAELYDAICPREERTDFDFYLPLISWRPKRSSMLVVALAPCSTKPGRRVTRGGCAALIPPPA